MRKIRTLLTVILLVFIFALPAAAAPRITAAKYKGSGRIEVEFAGTVSYQGVKVTVRDEKGGRLSAVITDRDRDDLDFRVTGVKQGKTYTFTISGIRGKGEKTFGSVKGKIRIPTTKGAVPVREVDYDAKDGEVEFTFSTAVQWKSPKVTITDGKKQYVLRISEKNRKEIEVKVRKLVKGKVYRYKITGIRKVGAGTWGTVSGTFTAQ